MIHSLHVGALREGYICITWITCSHANFIWYGWTRAGLYTWTPPQPFIVDSSNVWEWMVPNGTTSHCATATTCGYRNVCSAATLRLLHRSSFAGNPSLATTLPPPWLVTSPPNVVQHQCRYLLTDRPLRCCMKPALGSLTNGDRGTEDEDSGPMDYFDFVIFLYLHQRLILIRYYFSVRRYQYLQVSPKYDIIAPWTHGDNLLTSDGHRKIRKNISLEVEGRLWEMQYSYVCLICPFE